MTASPAARSRFDAAMMAIALRMAQRGLGTTAFNPSVGVVIADEATGEVIARGCTQPGGRPHGEKDALQRAGAKARGKTMYLTLEPCAHTGRTPTCADAVISAGLHRIACALADPNPVIAGSGFDQLRRAGVEVDIGLMAEQAHAMTLGHILHVTAARPFVQMKLAVSADDRVAIGTGHPVWVTGEQARATGHLLRARVDALITGIGTIRDDNPDLTCRLPGMSTRSPARIIVDTHASIDPSARLLAVAPDRRRPPVWLATSATAAASPSAQRLIERGQIAGVIPCGEARVDLIQLLASIDRMPIRRVLVEAGPRLSRSFLDAGLVDELVLFRGSARLGDSGRALFDALPFDTVPLSAMLEASNTWTKVDHRHLGADTMTIYRRNRS